MAFQLPPLPSFQTQIPDLQQKALEGAQLRNMLSEQALRQQLAPLQIQQQQQQVQAGQIQNTLAQMKLDSNKKLMDLVAGGLLDKFTGKNSGAPEGSGFDATGATAELAKQGVMLEVAQPLIEHFQNIDKVTSEIAKNRGAAAVDFLNNRAKAHSQLAGSLDDALRSERPEGVIPSIVAQYLRDPQGLSQDEVAGLKSLQPLSGDALVRTARLMSSVLNLGAEMDKHHAETAQKAAESAKAGAEAAKEGAAAAVPKPEQVTNALTGINSYALIPPNMRASLQNEIRNAPNKEALDKIQARADTINESFQRSADARAQAAAMRDVGTKNLVAGRLLQMDEELGKNLDQSAGIRGLLDLSKGGNETATAAALTRFAEHEIVEGGVKRMNQLEYQNLATKLGSYGRQFTAWADKGFQGAMPEATNKEIQTILDAEDAAAHKAHDRSVGYVMDRFGAGEVRGNTPPPPPNQGQLPKSLNAAQIQAYAQAHGISADEVKRQARAQGISVP